CCGGRQGGPSPAVSPSHAGKTPSTLSAPMFSGTASWRLLDRSGLQSEEEFRDPALDSEAVWRTRTVSAQTRAPLRGLLSRSRRSKLENADCGRHTRCGLPPERGRLTARPNSAKEQ